MRPILGGMPLSGQKAAGLDRALLKKKKAQAPDRIFELIDLVMLRLSMYRHPALSLSKPLKGSNSNGENILSGCH